jgi:NADH:ubiquinone oxidoreductase subunit K
VAERELPGGWLPPQVPGAEPASPEDSERPAFVQPRGQRGTNGLAVAALVCAISSLGLLVFSLGLSFLFSIPLGLTGWVCAVRAPKEIRPGQRQAAKVLAIIAVALSVAAAIAWLVLMAAGYSPEDLQRSLQEELDRQRQSS